LGLHHPRTRALSRDYASLLQAKGRAMKQGGKTE
jgi:hypothetical protein